MRFEQRKVKPKIMIRIVAAALLTLSATVPQSLATPGYTKTNGCHYGHCHPKSEVTCKTSHKGKYYCFVTAHRVPPGYQSEITRPDQIHRRFYPTPTGCIKAGKTYVCTPSPWFMIRG